MKAWTAIHSRNLGSEQVTQLANSEIVHQSMKKAFPTGLWGSLRHIAVPFDLSTSPYWQSHHLSFMSSLSILTYQSQLYRGFSNHLIYPTRFLSSVDYLFNLVSFPQLVISLHFISHLELAWTLPLRGTMCALHDQFGALVLYKSFHPTSSPVHVVCRKIDWSCLENVSTDTDWPCPPCTFTGMNNLQWDSEAFLHCGVGHLGSSTRSLRHCKTCNDGTGSFRSSSGWRSPLPLTSSEISSLLDT